LSVEKNYAKVVEACCKLPDVTLGGGGKGFGSQALKVKDKIFAMVSSRNEFVVKLPRQRVDDLLESGAGRRFDPGHGRLMKEWLVVGASAKSWLPLALEAMEFVRSRA
jgi:hypothetical protein